MRKLVGLGVSGIILVLLYASLDRAALARAIQAADTCWLVAGVLFVAPLTLLTAWRFSALVDNRVSFLEANRLILAASTLNLFLPSKLGDLAKGHVMSRRHGMDTGLSYATVVLEKALDMMSLLIWGVFGLIVVGLDRHAMLWFLLPVAGLCSILLLAILPSRILPFILEISGSVMPGRVRSILEKTAASWQRVSATFWRRPARAIGVIVLSVVIWGAHLFQFWLFSQALHGDVPILENAAFATLAILAGLLPFTFAGVGTRDAAIIFFYAPYLSTESAALLGILATLRYVIPAIAGAPFVGDFIGLIRGSKKAT